MRVRTNVRRRGFTIVELLVVVGVIGLLLGLLLPALSGARNRSRKTEELNGLRQVGLAWTMYANNNNDAALPGYLDADVQERWRVKYEYADRADVPPAPDFNAGDPNVAGPWPWRLMSYLDHRPQLLHAYLDEPMQERALVISPENPAQAAERLEHAIEFSLTPAFAYNGYYVGGWMELHEIHQEDGTTTTARPRFSDAESLEQPGVRVPVTARSIGGIRRSSELVTFCSGAVRPTVTSGSPLSGVDGQTQPQALDKVDEFHDTDIGYHLVTPPFLADEQVWSKVQPSGGGGGSDLGARHGGDANTIQVWLNQFLGDPIGVPVGRYTGYVAVMYADGHTDAQTRGALLDQRLWINTATSKGFMHTP